MWGGPLASQHHPLPIPPLALTLQETCKQIPGTHQGPTGSYLRSDSVIWASGPRQEAGAQRAGSPTSIHPFLHLLRTRPPPLPDGSHDQFRPTDSGSSKSSLKTAWRSQDLEISPFTPLSSMQFQSWEVPKAWSLGLGSLLDSYRKLLHLSSRFWNSAGVGILLG